MKKKILALSCLLAVTTAWADDAQEAPAFSEASTLSALIERIPGASVTIPWLPETIVHRYDSTRFDADKSMVDVHHLYGQWCKAKSGKILQPRDHNCTFLKSSLGCAVGELQYPGLNSDFERGFKDAASASGTRVQTGWEGAAWLLSRNVVMNLLFNSKGPQQAAIVGGLQRCIDERNALVTAMAFVSIDGNHDLLFLDERGYEAIARRGAELSKLAAEKKKEEAAQKKAQDVAKVAALGAGDIVIHLKDRRRGMVVEMKPPLAQIQWDRGYGTKTVEWNRLEELQPEKSR